MKVFELIEMLQSMDANSDVHYSYNYGDHWRTQVAPSVDSVEEGLVEYSSYHQMDKCVDNDEDEAEEDVRRVVVLS